MQTGQQDVEMTNYQNQNEDTAGSIVITNQN